LKYFVETICRRLWFRCSERNEVQKTILVQASNSLEETRWLLKLAEQNSFIAGVVGWVDLTADGFVDQLDEFTAHPRFKGVRHLVESEPQDDWLTQPRVLANLRTLAGHGVTYDLLVHTRHLKHALTVAVSCPELRLVIDHLAKPPIARGEIDDWSRGLRQLRVTTECVVQAFRPRHRGGLDQLAG
jgi:L-fuconolactonase